MSRFVFGTASLHHMRPAEQSNLLGSACDVGITHFDTAPYYGYGLAEVALGLFLTKRPQFTVTTKIGLYPPRLRTGTRTEMMGRKALGRVFGGLARPVSDFDVRRARASLEESLRRLKRDRVELLLIHEPEFADIDEQALTEWLHEERKRGRISAFGIAGEAAAIAPFATSESPLAEVIQTRDSLEKTEADIVLNAGRPLQLTYGYLASSDRQHPEGILRSALKRNVTGAVIISTRQRERIESLAQLGEA
jgi:aryl-alcohol dehydrogenase-like predicted oxidoreductase